MWKLQTACLHTLQDEVSALHIAVQNGHVEAVEALTHKMNKEDINARDNVSQVTQTQESL